MSGAFDQISQHNTFSCERLFRKAFFIISFGRDFFEVTVNTRKIKKEKRGVKSNRTGENCLLFRVVFALCGKIIY